MVTIGDIEHPWLRGYIERDRSGQSETRLARCKRDHRFVPRQDLRRPREFHLSEAEFTPKQIQTQQERVKLVYRIKIELDNSSHELKSNMPADAEIVLN